MDSERRVIEITQEAIDAIVSCLRHGNSCEIKRERDKVVVVEIQRKVKIMTSTNG